MGRGHPLHVTIVFVVVASSVAACGRLGFDPIRFGPPGSPRAMSTTINDGDAYTIGPRLEVTVVADGDSPPFTVRVESADADGNCRFADDGFEPYEAPSTTYDLFVMPRDGVKKACAWVRDAAGRTSEIVPEAGTPGVDTDTIELSTEHPPLVEMFSVKNAATAATTHAAGEPLTISFRVSDAEGLASDPIALYYTTERASLENWTLIADGFGGLEGTPTTFEGSYDDFTAPTDGPFRVKLVARDAAGNRSIAALSDVQNGGGFGVYAGSPDRGVETGAHTTALRSAWRVYHQFALHPRSRDVYALDSRRGIVHFDAHTGMSSRFMTEGETNLPDDGVLPAAPSLGDIVSVTVGPDGLLYVAGSADPRYDVSQSGVFYQIDLETRRCRRFFGGGDVFDESATADTAFAFPAHHAFDPDGTLFYMTSCTPGTWDNGTSAVRLMRATQDAEGRVADVSVVAGDCTRGNPLDSAPGDPTALPLGDGPFPLLGSVAVWGGGTRIYFTQYATDSFVIVDGMLYPSEVPREASLEYDPRTELLKVSAGGFHEYRPDPTGEDVLLRTIAGTEGSGRCVDDGVSAESACVHAYFAIQHDADGNTFFMEGLGRNEYRPYRVRYVDGEGALRTYFGAPPFHGSGLPRRVMRAEFAGIHYKPTTAPNQAAFPAGLYFLDYHGLVFGHFDPDGLAVVDWGNESGDARDASGIEISPGASIGRAYAGGDVQPLTFDDEGLPWLRYGPTRSQSYLVRIDASRRVVALQNGFTDWERAVDDDDPAAFELWPYGVLNNLTLKGREVFILGGYRQVTPNVALKAFDFGGGVVRHVMGGSSNGFNADLTMPGRVRDATLSQTCRDNGRRCRTRYRSDEDRLYFSEGTRLRYITSPSDPTASTLVTLFVQPDGAPIHDFIFRADGSQVFYLSGGQLHCHPLGVATDTWCDDSALGPDPIFEFIDFGTDQLTWLDDDTLLISTYGGEILAYDLAPL